MRFHVLDTADWVLSSTLVTETIHLARGVAGLYEAFALGTGSAAMALFFLLSAALAYLLVLAYARGVLSPARTYALGFEILYARAIVAGAPTGPT